MKNIILLTLFLFSVSAVQFFAQSNEPGTLMHPIVDSRMSKKQAFEGLDPKCPKEIRERKKAGGGSLSNHADVRAVDLNTFQNPYIKGTLILPPTAVYNPAERGTLTAESPIVRLFNKLGWGWGGTWTTRIDYQHFEKPVK